MSLYWGLKNSPWLWLPLHGLSDPAIVPSAAAQRCSLAAAAGAIPWSWGVDFMEVGAILAPFEGWHLVMVPLLHTQIYAVELLHIFHNSYDIFCHQDGFFFSLSLFSS